MLYLSYIFYIFLAFSALIIVNALISSHRQTKQANDRDPLDAMFDEIWSGEECDRLAAWDRVIVHIRCYHDDQGAILEATRRKQSLRRRQTKNLYVGKDGKLKSKKSFYHHE